MKKITFTVSSICIGLTIVSIYYNQPVFALMLLGYALIFIFSSK